MLGGWRGSKICLNYVLKMLSKFQIFLGGHVPRPPSVATLQFSLTPLTKAFPPKIKILDRTLVISGKGELSLEFWCGTVEILVLRQYGPPPEKCVRPGVVNN